MKKSKIFKCPVHGYISIPGKIVELFIDSAIFQRLRHIEQTSMRPLYPSAHHNRFVHSLGVYHLASTAIHYLEKNIAPDLKQTLQKYRWAFCIAALMHDCGHAPFSHSFEGYYEKNNRAQKFLFELIKDNDPDFESDFTFRDDEGSGPKPHEIFSSALLIKNYNEKWNKLKETQQIPISLAARMITGVLHRNTNSKEKQIENCLIKLINGPMDLDKLDYILRNTWTSGVSNVSIDVVRLLSAINIVEHENHLKLTYRKSALSVIQSVINGRNFLYRWIYTHHTVYYYNELLKKAAKTLFQLLAPEDNPDAFTDVFFSFEVFEDTPPIPYPSYPGSHNRPTPIFTAESCPLLSSPASTSVVPYPFIISKQTSSLLFPG